jgi:hypothetical protein
MKLFREATSELLVLQKRERFTIGMLDLIHGALARIFVGTPAKKFCAVPESTTGKMVICNFDDDSWSNWFPFASSIRAPTAGASRRVASETRLPFERFKPFR